jgi:hypothetical protein
MGKSKSKKFLGVAAWIGSVALALGVGTVVGESMPPKDSSGVKIGDPVVLDLAPWAGDIRDGNCAYGSWILRPAASSESTATTIGPMFPTSRREPSPNVVPADSWSRVRVTLCMLPAKV